MQQYIRYAFYTPKQLKNTSPDIYKPCLSYTGLFFGKESKSELQRQTLLMMAALSAEKKINVLLADDDEDDRDLFKEAVEEVQNNAVVTTVNDGDSLMRTLKDPKKSLPDIIFLDINMPCKNGQECLREIKETQHLKDIPVVIYSTSARPDLVDDTFKTGARYYIQKPDSYKGIKEIAKKILTEKLNDLKVNPSKDTYFISFNDNH